MNKETAARLQNELKAYAASVEMTDAERTALEEWVSEGNSVHENGSMAYTERGTLCDFLDVYRYEEDIRSDLAELSPKEKENYLARLSGEDTIDNLRDDLSRLVFKVRLYEQILRDHHLLEEADARMAEAKKMQTKLERQITEWMIRNPDVEMPFEQGGTKSCQDIK